MDFLLQAESAAGLVDSTNQTGGSCEAPLYVPFPPHRLLLSLHGVDAVAQKCAMLNLWEGFSKMGRGTNARIISCGRRGHSPWYHLSQHECTFLYSSSNSSMNWPSLNKLTLAI